MATTRESIKVHSDEVVGRVRGFIHEGNVRRIVIKHGEHTVLELPLTVAAVAAVLAPMLAAVGAVAALATDCTIEVERDDGDQAPPGGSSSAPPSAASSPPTS